MSQANRRIFKFVWKGKTYFTRVEKQKTGLFASKSVYWIRTNPQGWMVCRRRTDFDWLAYRLSLDFPGLSAIFDQKTSDLRIFLARLSHYPILFCSPFFTFFFSCTNEKLFAQRKAQEYNKDWEKELVLSSNGPKPETETTIGQKSIMGLLKDVNNEHKEVEIKQQILTEELSWKSDKHIEQIKKLKESLDNVCNLLFNLSEALAQVGRSFGDLSDTWVESEACEYFKLLSKEDGIISSNLYSQLKNNIFLWSNRVEFASSTFKKSIISPSDKIFEAYKELGKNLKIRREAVHQVCYSVKFQASSPEILTRREGRLKAMNEIIVAEYCKLKQTEAVESAKALNGLKLICGGTNEELMPIQC